MGTHILTPGATPLVILTRLHEITTALVESHGSLALLSNAREEGRAASYASFLPDMGIGGKDSVAARERQAEFGTLNIATEITILKADMAALEAEYRFLVLLLAHTTEVDA